MSLLLGGRGRTIATYVIAGVLLALVVYTVAYGIAYLVKLVGTAYTQLYEVGVNATGGGKPEGVAIRVANETVTMPKPSNPGLSSLATALYTVLSVVANALANPLLLTVLIALTLIAYALSEK